MNSFERKSRFKELTVDMKGQRVAHITQVTLSESSLGNRRFIYPNLFFDRCVAEMIALSWSIVSMGESMYQSAFLSFENCLNSVVVGSEAEHKFKNSAEN